MTPRQRQVVTAIRRYTDKYGVPPTVRELAEQLKINPSAVHGHLTRLRRDGHVDWDDGYYRTLRVL